MEHMYYRVAVLGFVGFIVWALHNPQCLWFLLLLFMFRKKEVKRNLLTEFDMIHDRLDVITRKEKDIVDTK